MSSEQVSIEGEGGAGITNQRPLTREELYDAVWKEPMLRIGERLGVSSSYMARVCTDLRVPRPPRGYWAQLEFGKTPPGKPPLPSARAGDATEWSPGTALALPKPKATRPAAQPQSPRERSAVRTSKAEERHELLVGVKPHFLKTRKTEAGLLRPFKKLLVDVVVSEKQLDEALGATSELFQALEAKGYRVTFGPPAARMRRAEFDERETPNKSHYHRMVWSPDRITVVYVGNVPIGLTLFETTEDVEVVYDHGEYVPVKDLSAQQLRRYQGPMHWRTKQSGASGRFCLQAYCPHWMVAWTKQWRGTSATHLTSQVAKVVAELEASAPVLSNLVTEAEAKAEAQRRHWEDEDRRRREEHARARKVKLRQDATADLLAAIEAWDRAQRVEQWLAAVQLAAGGLRDTEREHILGRLEAAKGLVGGVDALDLLKRWKAPEERE